MDRRELLKIGAFAAMGFRGLCAGDIKNHGYGEGGNSYDVLGAYGAEEHRKRLENLGFCLSKVRVCARRHQVGEYIAGQCFYNLGKDWQAG
jgi:hypothetical protein